MRRDILPIFYLYSLGLFVNAWWWGNALRLDTRPPIPWLNAAAANCTMAEMNRFVSAQLQAAGQRIEAKTREEKERDRLAKGKGPREPAGEGDDEDDVVFDDGEGAAGSDSESETDADEKESKEDADLMAEAERSVSDDHEKIQASARFACKVEHLQLVRVLGCLPGARRQSNSSCSPGAGRWRAHFFLYLST